MSTLNTSQLDKIKTLLADTELRLLELLNLDDEATQAVELDQSRVGRLSRMSALQQQALAQASNETHKQQLIDVHRALHKIEEADYGYCEKCGDAIPFKRLQIQPESGFCVDCLQALEDDQ